MFFFELTSSQETPRQSSIRPEQVRKPATCTAVPSNQINTISAPQRCCWFLVDKTSYNNLDTRNHIMIIRRTESCPQPYLRVVLLTALDDLHLVARFHPGRSLRYYLFQRTKYDVTGRSLVSLVVAVKPQVHIYLAKIRWKQPRSTKREKQSKIGGVVCLLAGMFYSHRIRRLFSYFDLRRDPKNIKRRYIRRDVVLLDRQVLNTPICSYKHFAACVAHSEAFDVWRCASSSTNAHDP